MPGTRGHTQHIETSYGCNAKYPGSPRLLHTVGSASECLCCKKQICHFLHSPLPGCCCCHVRGPLHLLTSSKKQTKPKVTPLAIALQTLRRGGGASRGRKAKWLTMKSPHKVV